jgi:hypothetical protein
MGGAQVAKQAAGKVDRRYTHPPDHSSAWLRTAFAGLPPGCCRALLRAQSVGSVEIRGSRTSGLCCYPRRYPKPSRYQPKAREVPDFTDIEVRSRGSDNPVD